MAQKFQNLMARMEGNVHFPLIVATGCCSVEMQNVRAATYDWSRLGIEPEAIHPSQADLLVVAGWVNEQTKKEIERAYAELGGRKSVLAVGACAISGSPYAVSGERLMPVSDFLPVDIFVPGCPPRPEAILDALRILNEKIKPGPDQFTVLAEALRSGH